MVAAERRYWVLEVLGRGAFGSVYRAELQGRGGFRKPVAIKMLHPDRTSSPEVVRRLRDEARLLAHVSHPGIVQVDGLITLQGQWSVVMEYVQGVSLRELIALGPVPILCAVQIVQQVADALDAAHNATDGEQPLGLVHRDIKPSNILLTRDGNVKLVDFGVAMANPESREASTDELFFGAAEYMAPERWEFRDTSAADIYSLGALFWELLTGEILGRTTANIERHCELVEGAVAQLEPMGNEELSELVHAMLSYVPGERPSARQVADDARDVMPHVPGPWLRDWAEREVPRARGRRAMDQDDPLLDALLAEGEDAEVTSFLPTLGRGTKLTGLRLVVLLTVAVLAVLTLWAVKATDALRKADDRITGQAISAAARSATPNTPEPAPADPELDAAPTRRSEPEPAAELSAPSSAPSPPPAPPVKTPSPAPAEAQVVVEGDASELFLLGEAGRFPAGAVPAGTYTVQARFEGRGLVEAGTVELAPGAQVTLTCDSGFALCKAQ